MVLCGDAGIAMAARDQGGVAILPYSALKAPAPYAKPDPVKLKKKPKPRIIPLPANNIIYDNSRGSNYAQTIGPSGPKLISTRF
jgi:hypothetical protein